jgi:hypothetical protein
MCTSAFDPGVKSEIRTILKAKHKYGGSTRCVTDIARLALQFTSCQDMCDAIPLLKQLCTNAGGDVIGLENKFREPTVLGYRYITVYVRLPVDSTSAQSIAATKDAVTENKKMKVTQTFEAGKGAFCFYCGHSMPDTKGHCGQCGRAVGQQWPPPPPPVPSSQHHHQKSYRVRSSEVLKYKVGQLVQGLAGGLDGKVTAVEAANGRGSGPGVVVVQPHSCDAIGRESEDMKGADGNTRGWVTLEDECPESAFRVKSSECGKYTIGQHVKGLAGGIDGKVVAVESQNGLGSGPGIIVVVRPRLRGHSSTTPQHATTRIESSTATAANAVRQKLQGEKIFYIAEIQLQHIKFAEAKKRLHCHYQTLQKRLPNVCQLNGASSAIDENQIENVQHYILNCIQDLRQHMKRTASEPNMDASPMLFGL